MAGNNKGFIQNIPSAAIHKLLKHKYGADAISLYMFLLYIAGWQNLEYGTRNRPHAEKSYCKKGLHWGTKRYDRANSILIEEGLKKTREARNKDGTLKGKYVELPFWSFTESPLREVSRLESPKALVTDGPTSATNTDSKDNKNTDSKVIPTSSDNKGVSLEKPMGKSVKTRNDAAAPNLPHIDSYLSGAWKELTQEEQQMVKDRIYKDSAGFISVQPHVIRNFALADFNTYLESLFADRKRVPESRRSYLLRAANYIRKGEQWKIADAEKAAERKAKQQEYYNERWGGGEEND